MESLGRSPGYDRRYAVDEQTTHEVHQEFDVSSLAKTVFGLTVCCVLGYIIAHLIAQVGGWRFHFLIINPNTQETRFGVPLTAIYDFAHGLSPVAPFASVLLGAYGSHRQGLPKRYVVIFGMMGYALACAFGTPSETRSSGFGDSLWVGIFRNSVNLWCLIGAIIGIFVSVFIQQRRHIPDQTTTAGVQLPS